MHEILTGIPWDGIDQICIFQAMSEQLDYVGAFLPFKQGRSQRNIEGGPNCNRPRTSKELSVLQAKALVHAVLPYFNFCLK